MGADRVTANDVRLLLKTRYAPPEWSLLMEVRNQTGFAREERYADAVAMNLWPSRGLEVIGFEVKVSRSDWLAELKNPRKSAAIQDFCDRWFIVAGHKAVVQTGELPPTWGLMVVQGGDKKRLVHVQEAPKLEPKALDRSFIASMLRRANESVNGAETNSTLYDEGLKEGAKRASAEQPHELRQLKREVQDLRTAIERFEKASGVKIESWDSGRIGHAVRLVLQHVHDPLSFRRAMGNSLHPLRSMVKTLEKIERSFELIDGLNDTDEASGW